MKKVFLGFIIMWALVGYSQSSLTVFNNGGQKFFLIMNGIKQNSLAQTNVVVSGVKNGGYSVKLIFEDGKTKDIDKNFSMDSPQDVTTKVVFKKGVGKLQLVSRVEAAGTVTQGAVSYRPDNNAVFSDAVTTTTTTTQTVTTESSTISSGNANSNNGNGNGSVGIQIVTPAPVPNETPANPGNGGVNIQFNDPNQPQNLNMNIDINVGTTTNGTTQQTTNVSGNSTATNSAGTSNSRMVCSKTLSNVETLKTELNGYSLEDDRVRALKISLKNKCLYAADALKVMDLFKFDANQLEVAKFLSDHLLDYDNASSIAGKFSFDSTKMEYMEYIGRD
ncbi:MAG: DUF4476 domain-containing protein [Bacteroidetes bacterium]|nr:DUF4476 domain-containing protein [Bacteroidota bacterium]MBM3425042.1 DUF4476 domain-containing protein [Bacteroidota bacterium]